MDIDVATPVIVRNNRLLIVAVLLLGIVGLLAALCAALLGLGALVPLHDFSVDRAMSTLWSLVFAGFLWTSGWTLYSAALRMVRNEARLDPEGVHFRLGPKKHPEECAFPWNQIASVSYKRTGNTQRYQVLGRDGRVVEFTALTFLRPRKLARAIAARCGQVLQRRV